MEFWRYFKRNGVRVVSDATVDIQSVSADQKPSAEVATVDGVAQFKFKIPEGKQGPQGPAATLNISVSGNDLLFS